MVSHRLTTLLACLFFGAILIVVSGRTYSMIGVPGPDFNPDGTSMGDFREVVYYPAKAVIEGVNPYDNRRDDDPTRYRNHYPVYNVFPVYSPILFPLAAPFSLLPYAVSQIVYWAVNVVLILLYAAVALRWAGVEVRVARVATLAALILLSRPGHANVYYGQVTLPVTLATIGALVYARARPIVSAALLALATLKPTFGGPAGLLMLARGDRKAAIVGLLLGGIIAIGGWSVIFYRDAHRENPIDVLLHNQSATEREPGVRVESTGNRIDLPLVAERLFGSTLAPVWRFGLPAGVLLAGAWFARRLNQGADADAPNVHRLSDALVLTSTVLCVYHNVYDALLLVPPLVWLGMMAWRPSDHRLGRALPAVAFAALLVPAGNYFSSHRFIELLTRTIGWEQLTTPEATAGLWTFVSILNGASITVGFVALIVMSSRMRLPILSNARTG